MSKTIEPANLSALFKAGKKVYFKDEKLPYTVMAVSERYAVVSRKLNRREEADLLWDMVRTHGYGSFTEAYEDNKDNPVYSLIDFEENVRAADNLVFGCHDYFSESGCQNAIAWLEDGTMGLSRRSEVELSVDTERTLNTHNKK